VLTCKITLSDSPHTVIINENHGFWAIRLARQNEFRFFCIISTKNILSFFAVGFCPQKLAFAGKIMALTDSGWLLHLCFLFINV